MASGLAIMSHDDKEEHARILRHIGEALRADLSGLTDVPPPRPILLQVLHLIRLEQERRGAIAEPISWEDLPDELRRLLQQLKSKQGPTKL
jgi:hypothetical protein